MCVCVCVQREDSDKIGPLAYYPPNGTFNLMYYPYYGKKAQVTQTPLNIHSKYNYTVSAAVIPQVALFIEMI